MQLISSISKLYILINDIFISLKHHHRSRTFNIEVLERLDRYIKEHFSFEEKLFIATKYPHYKAHKAEHAKFIKLVAKLHEDYQSAFFDLRYVLDTIVKWFLDHTQKIDRKFSQFLIEQKK